MLVRVSRDITSTHPRTHTPTPTPTPTSPIHLNPLTGKGIGVEVSPLVIRLEGVQLRVRVQDLLHRHDVVEAVRFRHVHVVLAAQRLGGFDCVFLGCGGGGGGGFGRSIHRSVNQDGSNQSLVRSTSSNTKTARSVVDGSVSCPPLHDTTRHYTHTRAHVPRPAYPCTPARAPSWACGTAAPGWRAQAQRAREKSCGRSRAPSAPPGSRPRSS
jgi:hypothetical protein